MTGFGSKELELAPFGKVGVELKSSNHKFLDIVFHLPEGFISLEDRIRKEIEAKVKRGRITCVVTFAGQRYVKAAINKPLLKDYISALKNIKQQFRLKGEAGIDTLLHLPGVLCLGEERPSTAGIWPQLKTLVNRACEGLEKMRQKEGRALHTYLNNRAKILSLGLNIIKIKFNKAVRKKLKTIEAVEERSGFLKNSDITEEIERLAFHIRNFKNKLSRNVPVGKELDFIAQEMQREANTMAAKSFDVAVSARVVQVKAQIEKIREQVQNVE
jgi:uncharacterized protein (TIGR00255 family)